MKPANKAALEECKAFGDMVKKGLDPIGISYRQRVMLEAVIADEFIPGYTSNRECPECVKAMITLAYFYYDKL